MADVTKQVNYIITVTGAAQARQEVEGVAGAASQAGAAAGTGSTGATTAFKGLGVQFGLASMAGSLASQAVIQLTSTIKQLISDAIQLTVTMADLTDAMGYIYSDAAPELIDVLDGISAATGYTREELYGLSRDIGAMIVPMGVASDEAAAMSANIVARAADAAAALGKDLPEASNALEQALKGSSRGARALGIDISEAAVQAELFAMGINKAASEVDEATLIQARYNLIMDATARYQGAAAAEMDTLEGAQRQVKAAWEEAALTVGEALEPSLTRLLGVVADIIPIGGDLLAGVIQLLDLGFRPLIAILEPTFGLLSIIRDGLQALEDKIVAEVPWIADLAGAWGDLTITWDEAETFLRDLLGLEATIPEITTSIVTATEQQNTAMLTVKDILAAVRGEAEGLTLAEIALAQATIQAEIALATAKGASEERIGKLSSMLQELETAREAIKAGEATYDKGSSRGAGGSGASPEGPRQPGDDAGKAAQALQQAKALVQLDRDRARIQDEAAQVALDAQQELLEAQRDAWNEAQDRFAELRSEEKKAKQELLEAQRDAWNEEQDRFAERRSEEKKAQQERMEGLAETLVDTYSGIFDNMENLDEYVEDMIKRWAAQLLKAFAIQTLTDAFTGGLGGKLLGAGGGGKLLGGK